MNLNTGGLPIVLPDFKPASDYQGFTLISDVHLGAANVDLKLLGQELEIARTHGDRILIGGDLYDLILPTDRKRYPADLNNIHPRLQGRKNIVNEVLDWAGEILSPYADLIDVVGCGNHETALETGASFDIIAETIKRLSGRGHQVAHGSYQAFIQYKLPKRETFTIWYHHGSGKSGKVHLELKKLMDQASVFNADVYWSGHSHNRANATETRIHASDAGIVVRDVKCIITGSYLQTYNDQDQTDIKKKGRKSNYAADVAVRPHGLGGARLILRFAEPGYPAQVQVIQ